MSTEPIADTSAALDHLEAFAKSVEGMSDEELRANVQLPETRAKVLDIRESIQPWLRAFNRVANADRRLAKALDRTAGQVRA